MLQRLKEKENHIRSQAVVVFAEGKGFDLPVNYSFARILRLGNDKNRHQ